MVLLSAASLPFAAQATPPIVQIASPVSGETICGTITVSATAADSLGIVNVAFEFNGTPFGGGPDTTQPYAVFARTNDVADGVYSITAIAVNRLGEQTTSLPVTVTVNNAAPNCASKFTPNFLAYYNGPTLTAADANLLGKFDLLDVARYHYFDINSPGTWAAVKAVNPNIKVYLYEDGPEDENFDDTTPQVGLQGIARYGDLNSNHPELFLRDSAGNKIYNKPFSSPLAPPCNDQTDTCWYLMDFGSPTYQSYWLGAVQADITNQVWVADGVHADNCITLISSFSPYSATSPVYPDDAHWYPAMNAFASAITAGMHAQGQKLWCNRGGAYTIFDTGKAAWAALDASPTPPDVVADEGAFAVSSGPANWATQFVAESQWRSQIDTLHAVKNSKVAIFSHTKLQQSPPGDTGLDNWNQPVTYWQSFWYAFGSFQLAKNDSPNNAYFAFFGNSESADRIWYADEYDFIDLGKAVGPYAVTTIGSTNIYWREFEKGYVYVNPTINAVSVPLASTCTCRQRTHDNLYTPASQLPVVTNIQLNGHNAAIVLKT